MRSIHRFKQITIVCCLLLVFLSTPAWGQAKLDPHILSKTVEEYTITTKIYLVDEATFRAVVFYYFGPGVQCIACCFQFNDGTKEIYVVKKYGKYNEPSSEDVGHEVKHLIDNQHKKLTGRHRFDPDCRKWIEHNGE